MKIILTLLLLLTSVPAWAKPQNIEFEILRGGKPFGTHKIQFSQGKNDTLVAKIDINMNYSLGPVTLFTYSHSNKEVWKGNRLVSVNSTTNDDGDKFLVEATWDRERLEVRTKDKLYDAQASVLSTSYWNKKMLDSKKLLNTQYGTIEDISVRSDGMGTMMVAGEKRNVRKYLVNASVPVTVYYDAKTNEWVGLEFTARGSPVTYRRLNPVGS